MDSDVGNLIRKIVNLPDGLQVQVFRSIASFPAISMPVLEMTGNELARVFESSRTTPLGEPDPLPEEGGGWGVTTRAKHKKKSLRWTQKMTRTNMTKRRHPKTSRRN